MRMWMVDAGTMCRKHLLGEHGEIHKHKPSFQKGHSIKGRIWPVVQVEPMAMKRRHDELAAEMRRRGYRHQSPYRMPSLRAYTVWERIARVDVKKARADLHSRCAECAAMFAGKNS